MSQELSYLPVLLVNWAGIMVLVSGTFLMAFFIATICLDTIVNAIGKRTYDKLCALHGVMKVRMALQNSKFIRWQWPDIDDLEDKK